MKEWYAVQVGKAYLASTGLVFDIMNAFWSSDLAEAKGRAETYGGTVIKITVKWGNL